MLTRRSAISQLLVGGIALVALPASAIAAEFPPSPDLDEAVDLLATVLCKLATVDPVSAYVVWRRGIDRASWSTIADETGLTVDEASARFSRLLSILERALREDMTR